MPDNKKTFDNEVEVLIIAAYLYVSKHLPTMPKKAINFIKVNRDYFPSLSDEELRQIMSEHNLTDDDIILDESVRFKPLKSIKHQ